MEFVKRHERFLLCGVFFVYAVITLVGATHHELWFDEAQAWGIARDATLSTLPEVLKHEGHPALWFIILMPFAKAGASCAIINIISWFFSVAAAGLFVWKAPFGPVLKAAMLFSSGFLFFNSVNSRVYCLIPLLLFLIALVYPKRDKYAPIFGLLVGLLANTHILMGGLVGILGIYMLIELFSGIKQEGLKKNLGRIAGLIIAGILVIAMIIPLLGCLSTNNMVQGKKLDIGTLLLNSVSVFKNIGANLMIEPNWLLSSIAGAGVGLIVISAMLLMFAYRRSFIMCVCFTLVYALIIEGIWYTTPLRAPIFVYTYIAIFWIAIQNEQPKPIDISSEKASAFGKRIINSVNKAFARSDRFLTTMLCAALISSVPAGLYWLVYDSFNRTVLTEDVANFISKELPNDAVILVDGQTGIQFNVYNPDIRLYSLELQKYITYHPHEIVSDEMDLDKIEKDLENEPNLYYLAYWQKNIGEFAGLFDRENLVYYDSIKIPSYAFAGTVKIWRVELEDVLRYSENLAESIPLK